MKRAALIVPVVLAALAVAIAVRAGTPEIKDATIHVYFSPGAAAPTRLSKRSIRQSRRCSSKPTPFTSKPIAQAVVDAHKRGVKVEVVLDKSQRTEKYTEADFIAHAGVPTRIDAQHEIAHNKIIIIDDETVVTGSFNFTRAAQQHNAENLLIIKSKTLADQYTTNWQEHAGHSETYAGR